MDDLGFSHWKDFAGAKAQRQVTLFGATKVVP
jgi:hypothetical protein